MAERLISMISAFSFLSLILLFGFPENVSANTEGLFVRRHTHIHVHVKYIYSVVLFVTVFGENCFFVVMKLNFSKRSCLVLSQNWRVC